MEKIRFHDCIFTMPDVVEIDSFSLLIFEDLLEGYNHRNGTNFSLHMDNVEESNSDQRMVSIKAEDFVSLEGESLIDNPNWGQH